MTHSDYGYICIDILYFFSERYIHLRYFEHLNNGMGYEFFLHVYHEKYIIFIPGDIENFKEYAFCNFEFILAMAHALSIHEVLRNLEYVFLHLHDQEIFLIYNCLKESISVLSEDPLQLASELIGRLREISSKFYEIIMGQKTLRITATSQN